MKPSEKLLALALDDIPEDMTNREYWLKTEIHETAKEVTKLEAVAETLEQERKALADFFWECRKWQGIELDAYVQRMGEDPTLFAAGQERPALAALKADIG